MSMAGATTVTRGRTSLTSRAIERVVSAVSADELGVSSARVAVDLADQDGELVLTVKTPIRVSALGRGTAKPSTSGTILDRALAAQSGIRQRVSDLTGYRIGRVIVTITGADIQPESRVR